MCDDVISKAYDACDVFFSSMEERMNYINSEIASMDYRSDIRSAREKGREEGREEAKDRFRKLLRILTAQNRMEDIARIASDEAYLQKMLIAYNI